MAQTGTKIAKITEKYNNKFFTIDFLHNSKFFGILVQSTILMGIIAYFIIQ